MAVYSKNQMSDKIQIINKTAGQESSSIIVRSLLKYSVIVVDPFLRLLNIIFKYAFLAVVLYPNSSLRLVQSSGEELLSTTRLSNSTLIKEMSQLSSNRFYLFQAIKAGFSGDFPIELSGSLNK